jgi:hypothetical protein
MAPASLVEAARRDRVRSTAMDELSQIDLAFCVDLTSSMAPFIQAARQQMVLILGGLRGSARADLRVAVVGYRDHDPDPAHRPTEMHPFTAEDAKIQRILQSLAVGSAPSNRDAAEAVFAGLDDAMSYLEWRPRAFRVIVLIGDGPPHACGADAEPWPDRFPKADPTGYSLVTLCNALEEAGLFVHALGMVPSSIPVHDGVLQASFSRLAGSTGGTYRVARDAQAAIAVVEAIGRSVFGQMEFDRQLFAALVARSEAPPSNGARAQLRQPERTDLFAARAAPAGPARGRSAPPAFAPPPAMAPRPAAAHAPPPPAPGFAPPPPAGAYAPSPAPGFAPPPPAAAQEAPPPPDPATEDLAAAVGASSEEVQASLARLKKRGLLPE